MFVNIPSHVYTSEAEHLYENGSTIQCLTEMRNILQTIFFIFAKFWICFFKIQSALHICISLSTENPVDVEKPQISGAPLKHTPNPQFSVAMYIMSRT